MNLLEIRNDVLKDIKSMTVFNHPMMRAVFSHKECVEELLSSLFDKPVHIKDSQVEYYISNLHGKESRLDILVESNEGEIIDIEVQKEKEGYTFKRLRLYFGGTDNHFIKSGTKYEEIPDSYMIYIYHKDYFERGLPMYRIKRVEMESQEEVDDGQEIYIVNGEYKDESTEIGRMIHDFHCIEPSDMYSKSIKKWFRYYKQEKGGVKKMCEITRKWMGIGYEEGILVGKEEGYTSGKIEGRAEGKIDILINLLKRKLGCLSENIINIINSLDEKAISTIALNIFDIDKEEDILKYILR